MELLRAVLVKVEAVSDLVSKFERLRNEIELVSEHLELLNLGVELSL